MFLPGLLYMVLSVPPRQRFFLLWVFLTVCAFEPSLWFAFTKDSRLPWLPALMAASDVIVVGGYAVTTWYGLQLGNTGQRPRIS